MAKHPTEIEKENEELKRQMLPLIAQAALNGGGDPPGSSVEMQDLIKELLGDLVEKHRTEKEKREKRAYNAAMGAQELIRTKNRERSECNHLKQDGTSRLAGQELSGSKQIVLVCQFCHQEFYAPALEGQLEIPRHLMPDRDSIGI